MVGKKHSAEWKKHQSISLMGHKMSLEAREKMKVAKSGSNHPWFGRHPTEEHKKKLSETKKGELNPQYGKKGYLSPSWKGGISFEPYSVDWTKTFKRGIRERDKYTCRVCGREPAVCVHHTDYNKKNCNPSNLVTLCVHCHSKTTGNRKYWLDYFINEFKKEEMR
jgi:hypothetical protein